MTVSERCSILSLRENHGVPSEGVPGMGALNEKPEAEGAAEQGPVRVEVENFGPIRQGAVTLKPLTVFIGPNNSGKSYMAMLVDALSETLDALVGEHRLVRQQPSNPGDWPASLGDGLTSLADRLSAMAPGAVLTVPQPLTDDVGAYLLRRTFERDLQYALMRSFSCGTADLVPPGESHFGVALGTTGSSVAVRSAGNGLSAQELPATALPSAAIRRSGTSERWIVAGGGDADLSPTADGRPRITQLEHALRLVALANLDSGAWGQLSSRAHYIPATRSGIMQVHRTLAASIIEQVTAFGNGASAAGVVSGTTADLLTDMLRLDPSHSAAFSQVICQFERDTLGGEVVAETLGEFAYPTISYRLDGMSIPLPRASSTVSELAPIILMLKHTIEQGDVAIIEEPEAHLHPANQAKLAHLLVRLVRRGLRLIITTHSDYLLEQLGNFVMLSGVTAESRRERHGYQEDDYLTPEEVGVYLFRPDEEAGGHVIEPVTVDQEDGIYLDEFLRVNEVLYDETIRIRREILDE